jgi:pimeloyl-ACP methyl ester carboxylesterase
MNGSAGKTPPACAHGIAKLAVSQEQVRSVKLPVHILVGDRDPCRWMYVEPLQKIRPEWPVTLIEGAGHLNCIVQPQFKEQLLKWLEEGGKT